MMHVVACCEPDIRIIRHSVIPESGSFEVRFDDGRPSLYWYWDDNAGRRSVRNCLDQESAKKQAQEFARAARDKLP
jgi:hypothetical protein